MAWGFVTGQKAAADSVAATTSATFPGNCTTNNRIIVHVSGHNQTVAANAVTDGAGNTYTKDIHQADTAATDYCVYSANIGAGGGTAIQVNVASANVGQQVSIIILEYSGLDTTGSSVDVSAASTATSGTTAASGSTAATGAANEVVIGSTHTRTNVTITAAGGATQEQAHGYPTGAVARNMAGEDQDSGGSGSTPATSATLGSTAEWVQLAVAYKLAGGGGAAAPHATVGSITPGSTWKRQYWKGVQNPYPFTMAYTPQPLQAVNWTAQPGVTWQRHFQRRLTWQQWVGGGVQNFLQTLTGGLSFTGPTTLTNAVTKNTVGATLSFTGAFTKKTSSNLIGAVLSFTGPANLIKLVTTGLAGVVSFTGPTNLLRAIVKSLTGGLSFTGPTNLIKAISKGMTGGLSFTGSLVRSIFTKLVGATLSFAGNIAKLTSSHLIAAGLSFSGAVSSTRVFLKSLAGGLSFTGPTNLVKAVNKGVTGGLSFTGNSLVKAITKGITGALSFTGPTNLKLAVKTGMGAGLSFAGAIFKLTKKGLVAAGLSFSGAITNNKIFLKALAGTLSFVGAVNKQTGKALGGGLSFTGAQSRAIKKGLSAGLSFSGSMARFIRSKLSAALSFSGQLVGSGGAVVAGVIFVTALTRDFAASATTRTFAGAILTRDFLLRTVTRVYNAIITTRDDSSNTKSR